MIDHTFHIGGTDAQDASLPIAAFDYDGTLVRPCEGRQHARDIADWRWMRPTVPDYLTSLARTHAIWVITDQTKAWKIEQIRTVLGSLGIPITVIVGGKTKKPDTTWAVTCLHGQTPAYYVGDAAGRPDDWSDCDRVFAERLCIPFHTPESVFPVPLPLQRTVSVGENTAVILVGYPGSGKSTIAREIGGARIDGDALRTPAAMLREAQQRYAAGERTIVFDSTGGTVERRRLFLEWAHRVHLRPVVVWVQTDIDTSMDWARARGGRHIPAIAFFAYRKHFVAPSEDEGATLICVR